MPVDVEYCIRRRTKIEGKNYYLLVGKRFVQITIPRENDPKQTKERTLLNKLSEEITIVLKELNKP